MVNDRPPPRARAPATRLVQAGRDRTLTGGGVNPQVQRASTVLVEKAEDLYASGAWTYGLHGTNTHSALKEALCALEEARHCILAGSGLLACTLPFLAICEPGAHVLVTDNVYGPTRRFCDRTLRQWGVVADYFDPGAGSGIAALIRPETRLVFLESPGSLTFEVCDTPAITSVARAAGVVVAMDNTWGSGLYHRPLDLGVDLSIQATTKYASGGADVLGGAILTNSDTLAARLADTVRDLGLSVSPDDAYLILRGLRSMPTRIERQSVSGLSVARWLASHPKVQRVLHPAHESDPHHDLWKRDFSGAAGVFGVVLRPAPEADVNRCLNALRLFGMGFSWGGYESLIIPCDPQIKRTLRTTRIDGPLLRLSIGLEAVEDLLSDLDQALSLLP
jgi:cysteine-S-conjugate beta-lyase